MDRKKTCNCLNDCPCYPNCDQMMSDGQLPGVPKSAWRADLTAEEEDERDWRNLKEQYPDTAKMLLAEVESACDSMEYEGSMMFDSTPDRMRVCGIAEQICGRVKDRCSAEEMADPGSMVQVLLYQEMFHRRCRRRGCRRW